MEEVQPQQPPKISLHILKKYFLSYKKLISLLILLIVLPVGLILVRQTSRYRSSAALKTVNFYFSPGNTSLPPNLTENVMLNTGTAQVSFIDVTVIFDPAKVKLNGEVTTTDTLKTIIKKSSMAEANSTGRLSVVLGLSIQDRSNPPSGTISAFRIPLTAVTTDSNQNTVLDFSLPDIQVVDTEANKTVISAVSSSLGINVKPTFIPTTPIPVTLTPTPPGTALVITDIHATDITQTTTNINWNLSDYGTGQVEYGKTTAYGLFSEKETSFDWNYHTQALGNLSPGTQYHYRVISTNRTGQTTVSGDYTFTTLGSVTLTPTPIPTSIPTPTPIPVTLTPTPPGTALVITDIHATDITQTTTNINWNLSDYGTGQVEYGKTTAYGLFSEKETSFDWNYHTQALGNLSPGTQYHYRVISTNRTGQTTVSGDYTFTTLGYGLTGYYFKDLSLNQLSFKRLDPVINFNWGYGSPQAGFPWDNFSIRWNGWVEAPYSGSVTFITRSDDGVRLWINNIRVINKWTRHSAVNDKASVNLTAGVRYPIRLEYFENTGRSQIRLGWNYGTTSDDFIPTRYLSPEF